MNRIHTRTLADSVEHVLRVEDGEYVLLTRATDGSLTTLGRYDHPALAMNALDLSEAA